MNNSRPSMARLSPSRWLIEFTTTMLGRLASGGEARKAGWLYIYCMHVGYMMSCFTDCFTASPFCGLVPFFHFPFWIDHK